MKRLTPTLGAVLCGLSSPLFAQQTVDTELLLLIDISGSVSDSEFDLMMGGYEAAFRSQTVIDAIGSGNEGSIAVGVAFWSGRSQQTFAVNYTKVSDAASGNAFADAIATASQSRPFRGRTGVAAALEFGALSFGTETGGAVDNGFTSAFQVIDISGDGEDNDSLTSGGRTRPQQLRFTSDQAIANGVDLINGLPIGNSSLDTYYQQNIIGGSIGGTAAFTQRATGFASFEEALVKKLQREITIAGDNTIPEPSSALLGLLGSAALLVRRKRG